MNDHYYTFALWKIKDGKEDEFLSVWEYELASAFLKFNPYAKGKLIQSLENPNIFYSFSPWANLEQMQSARSDEKVRTAISKLISLCDEAKPGSFKMISSVSGTK